MDPKVGRINWRTSADCDITRADRSAKGKPRPIPSNRCWCHHHGCRRHWWGSNCRVLHATCADQGRGPCKDDRRQCDRFQHDTFLLLRITVKQAAAAKGSVPYQSGAPSRPICAGLLIVPPETAARTPVVVAQDVGNPRATRTAK